MKPYAAILIAAALIGISCSNFMDRYGNGSYLPDMHTNDTFRINDEYPFCYERTVSLNSSIYEAQTMQFDDGTNSAGYPYSASQSWIFPYGNGIKSVTGIFTCNDGAHQKNASVQYIDKAYLPGGSTGDHFGQSVSLSSNGLRMASGAPGADSGRGSVIVCDWDGLSWNYTAINPNDAMNAGDNLGCSVAISSNGQWVAAGAPGRNSIYIFYYNGSAWVQHSRIESSSAALGTSVAIYFYSTSDITVASGGYSSSSTGGIRISHYNGTAWSSYDYTLGSGDLLGYSLALSENGTVLAAGAPGLRQVVIYRNTGSWSQSEIISSTEEGFGSAVDLSPDGTVLLAGARLKGLNDDGEAYLYTYGTGWTLTNTFVSPASAGQFGYAVSLSGDCQSAVIGAPRFSNTNLSNTGAVYRYSNTGGSWSLSSQINPEDSRTDDYFGCALSSTSDFSTFVSGSLHSRAYGTADKGSVYIYRD